MSTETNANMLLSWFFWTHVSDVLILSFGMQIKLSKKSSVKDMAKLIKEKLQISDVETVASPDNVKDDVETVVASDNVKDEL